MSTRPAASPGVHMLAISELRPDPSNPRRVSVTSAMVDLAQSIEAKGILQPLIVRVVPGTSGYQIVCGHRRFTAGQAAGLEAVPCILRELSDDEAREVQLVENLQRADLHPMDEAEAFERLAMDHGLDAADIAARVARSPRHVYQRMKLTALGEAGRKAFLEGALTPGIALVLARVPAALQSEVLERFARHEDLTTSQAREIVQGDFMLDLKGAPFDASDACLLAAVPACGACPKRTGSSPLLFDDVEKGDTCTDPGCFHAKAAAAWTTLRAKAEAKGTACVEDESGAHSDWTGNSVRSQKYAEPTKAEWIEGEHRTLRSLVPKGQEPPTTLLRLKGGRTVKVWDRAEALKVARAAGTLKTAKAAKAGSGPAAKRDAAMAERVSVRIKQAALTMLRGDGGKRAHLLAADLICETKVHMPWFAWAWPALGLEAAGDLHKTAKTMPVHDLMALAFVEAIQNADEDDLARHCRLDPEKLKREALDALSRDEEKAAAPAKEKPARRAEKGRAVPSRKQGRR